VYAGQDAIFVSPYLDWKAGDILGLAATNIEANTYETVTVKDYIASSGHVFLEQPLKSYHFGQSSSTGD